MSPVGALTGRHGCKPFRGDTEMSPSGWFEEDEVPVLEALAYDDDEEEADDWEDEPDDDWDDDDSDEDDDEDDDDVDGDEEEDEEWYEEEDEELW